MVARRKKAAMVPRSMRVPLMPKAEGSIFDVQVLLDADDEPDALDAESKRVDFTKAFTSNGEAAGKPTIGPNRLRN